MAWECEALDDTIKAAARKSAGGDNVYYIGDTREKGLEYIGYCAKFARVIATARGESQDPFFSQPYSAAPAAADEAPPAWDTPQRQRPGRSANIKPKRTVAALLKAAAPVTQ